MDLSLTLTHDCNLACSYCYAGPKSRRNMTWDVAKQSLDFAFSFNSNHMQLGFFGGEPLMQWELLKKTARHAEKLAEEKEISLVHTLTSNGSLVTKEKAKWLREHNVFTAISIDGNKIMHDKTRRFRNGKSSFNQCVKGLSQVISEFAPEMYEVIVVIDPANIANLAESVRYLKEELNVYKIAINPNFYTVWSEEALKEWEKQFHDVGAFYLGSYRNKKPVAINFVDNKIITRLKNGFEKCDFCDFGEKEIAIAPSGNIYPCERLVSDDTDSDMCIGNVFDGFDTKKRRDILKKRGNINHECGDCDIKNRCMNWCCCINYATTGNIDRVDGLVCFHEQLAISVADQAGAELYAENNPHFMRKHYYA